jgi:hypothetical protein
MAIKYRLNQQIKYLYKKKATLNQKLYEAYLECANQWKTLQRIIQRVS